MTLTTIRMVQHVVSMISRSMIDKLDHFMKLYVIMDVLLIVFNGLSLIILLVLIILINNYGIIDQIFTNSNIRIVCQKHNDEELEGELGESVIIDNTSTMIRAGFGNSTKQLIKSFFIAYKATSGAGHSTHAINLNDNYFHFRNDSFANYYINTSVCSELFFRAEIDTIVDWNTIFAMLDQLLANTIKTQVILSSLPVICEPRGNHVVIREYNYNIQKLYLTNDPLANFYYRNETKANFESTITETLFANHSISLRCEGRIECAKNTAVVFDKLFGNTTNHAYVAENVTIMTTLVLPLLWNVLKVLMFIYCTVIIITLTVF